MICVWLTPLTRTCRYLTNSIFDLKTNLKKRNSDLSLWAGLPELVVPDIVRALQKNGDTVEGVWMTSEVNTEEVNSKLDVLYQAMPKLIG